MPVHTRLDVEQRVREDGEKARRRTVCVNERRVPLPECYKYDQLRVTYMVRGDNEKSGAVFAAQVYDEGTPSVSSWK